jgi:DNA (cytosine-5)-methyltransferase 1
MKFATVCSGIGAPETAWIPLGWECQFHSEIEPFPSAVLKHHYPNTPNLGDMTKWKGWPDYAIDLICGGCPCQSFSIAGLRKGLDDPRGNLTLTYLAIINRYRPRWVVYENVPGLLSDKTGAFGAFLGGLAELGYGFAYRILDAQFTRVESHPHAVPQRRRRLFVVGYCSQPVGDPGDWRVAAAVLLERESLQRNTPPCREAGKRVAPSLSQSLRSSGGIGMSNQELFSQNGGGLTWTPEISPTVQQGPPFSRTGNDRVECDAIVATWPAEVAPTLNAAFGDKQGLEDQHINGGGALIPV